MEVVERAEVRSSDLAEVYDLITRRYVDHSPRVLDGRTGFSFRSDSASAGGLTIDHMVWSATMAIAADPFDTIVVASVLDGRFDVTSGGEHVTAGRGETVMYLPGLPVQVIMDRVALRIAQFPRAGAARVASRSGVDPDTFRFERLAPATAAGNRHWLATMAYLTRLFAGPEPAVAHPLMLAAAVEVATVAAVAVFPNSTMTVGYTAGPGRVEPASLRRAMAYIDDRAGEPITLERIAEVAGVSVRGLQLAFRRHRDTTPTGYLRRVRLERAHRDLLAGDPARGDTVAAIARRWGFASPGRFAADYRRTFARTPFQTLRS